MVGKKLAHFRITAKLGKGGMGEVYRAEDTKLGRAVAIKLLSEEQASDPQWLERFEREAKAVASLNHPNIVTIYSIEQIEGTQFFSMELVEGKTLAESIPSAGVSVDVFWDVVLPLVDAVAASHQMGVTHRDLKPGNVMIDRDGRLKVLDFGIAKVDPKVAFSSETDEATWAMTEPGMIMGTMPYMSPEQVQGRSADSRSDVFSLGVMLYELITGKRPFRSDTPAELISSLLRDDPQGPSLQRSGFPRALDAVVLKCLAKNPTDRYRSGAEVRVDLERARQSDASEADPRIDDAPSIAVLPFADMSLERDQEYFCDGMADEIINAITGIEGLRVASRTSSFGFRGTDADIQRIGRQLRVATVLEGSVRKAGTKLRVTAQLTDVDDGYNVWSRKFDRELEDVFVIQDEIAQSIVEALRVELSARERRALERSATSDVAAYDWFLRGRKFFYEGTRKGIELACEMYSRAARRDPEYALAYAGLANCHSYLFMYFDRTAANRLAAIEASRKASEYGEGLADVHAARGLALSLDQQYDDAGREFEAALVLNPRLFEAHYFYGRVCREQGNFESAARYFEQAARVRPEDYQSLVFLAAAYADLGRSAQERATKKRALAAIEKHLEAHPHDARALYLGSGLNVQLGDAEKGFEWADRALAIDPGDSRVLYNVACVYCKAGRLDAAVDHFVRAIDAGYASREWIAQDSDLDPIRDHPRFQAALAMLE